MWFMFSMSKFQGDLSRWDVGNVRMMACTFLKSPFHGDVSGWDVSNVGNMNCLFCESAFHGDLSRWNVSKVFNMRRMFEQCPFDGDISSWVIGQVQDQRVFSRLHHSPLGYLDILRNEYAFPKEDPLAERFEHLRAVCNALNMDRLSTAYYVYRELHGKQGTEIELGPSLNDE